MIQFTNITVSYGKKTIINNLSGSFEENKVYCILGRSGCGKSTLLKTISGLLKPSSGLVLYQNKPVTKPIKDIFMMHQAYTNFPWKNCLDNVLFPIKLNRKVTKEDIAEAQEMLKKVGLENHSTKYPDELSGGMKQRLALARILVSKPKVILMDEPLSALDDNTRNEMQNLILDMHKATKNTIIMVTHNINDAQKMGDQIINL